MAHGAFGLIAPRISLLRFLLLFSFAPCVFARAGSPAPLATLSFSQFPSGHPIHLVAYGDSRFAPASEKSAVNPRVRQWLAQRVAEQHPDAILLTGDTPYHGASEADWKAFRKETGPWRTEHALVLPATGNHEIYGGASQGISNFLNNFPEIQRHRYYSALLGNVEVISLDCTQAVGPASPQARWFAAQLQRVPPQVDFLVILYHIPWMADRQSQLLVSLPTPDAMALRTILEARLAHLRARVLVLNGHIHNYERFQRKGVTYVVTGGGGAEPYPLLFRGSGDLYRDSGFPVYHFVAIDVEGSHLHAVMWKVKDPDATSLDVEAKDEFTLDAAPASKVRKPGKRR